MSTNLVTDPIYQQLNKILRELMASDEFKVGDRFLTERSICDKYNVSRATANKALSNLVSEGLLKFKKGVGTFIVSKPVLDASPSIASFTHNARIAGMVPTSKILTFRKIRASEVEESAAEVLGLEDNEEIFLVERLRFADRIPMVLEHRYIRAKFCPDLTKDLVEESLYALFVLRYELNITSSEETIQAVTLSPDEARLLDVEPGKAGFLITAIGIIDDSTPLWYEKTLHRPDGFSFRCRVLPHKSDKRLQERLLLSAQKPKDAPAPKKGSRKA